MLIDIHRHSKHKGKADIVLQNLFHDQNEQTQAEGYFSLGLHPWHVKKASLQEDLEKVISYSDHSSVLAIGESGIDKVIDADLSLQRRAFAAQINIAKQANKPMVIHCVRAYDELQQFRKKNLDSKPWIFHWYNASPQTGMDLISKNCYLSFGHLLFVEHSKACKTFLDIPLERIFLETDDADVTIEEVYNQAAKLRRLEINDLKNTIKDNFFNCFGIRL